MSEAGTCRNCDYNLSELSKAEFCPNCGQKQQHARYRVKAIIHEFFSVVLNVERGLLHTIGKLFTNPGDVVRGYWDGLTKRYYNPVRYAFVMATLSALITITSGVYDQQMLDMESDQNQSEWMYGMGQDLSPEELEEQKELNHKVQQETKKYLSFISLVLIPIGAFAMWLFYKRDGMFYGEALIATAYFIGHTSLLSIFFTILSLTGAISPVENLIGSTAIYIVFGTYILKSTFKADWFSSFGNSVAIFFVSVLSMVIGLLLLSVVAGIIAIALK